jgi:ribonuclease-3
LTPAETWSQKKLGYRFNTPELLTQALTHKSRSSLNNERMEFLGDALLGLTIAEALYTQEESLDEGGLSRLRASLVRRETLAEIAAELGLGDMLLLGGGESRSGGHHRQSIMADALEALFGAIYLDQGFAAAAQVILTVYGARLKDLPDAQDIKDAKTLLQEQLQADGLAVPDYDVLSEEGPAHSRRFTVRCSIIACGIETTGEASSRRGAEQVAAAEALERLNERDK